MIKLIISLIEITEKWRINVRWDDYWEKFFIYDNFHDHSLKRIEKNLYIIHKIKRVK